jgi:hypothetical protein
MAMREASSDMLRGGVTHPSQARQRSWIQVTRTAGGNWGLKIIRVGMKIPRGGRRGRDMDTLQELFQIKQIETNNLPRRG